MLEHNEGLQVFLKQRWQELFGASLDLLLCDLTSAYFEIDPPSAPADKRRYGYSRSRGRYYLPFAQRKAPYPFEG